MSIEIEGAMTRLHAIKGAAVFLGVAVAALPAQAQMNMTLRLYEDVALSEIGGKANETLRRYLRGMATGIEAVMVEYRDSRQKLLFCLPPDRRLDMKELRTTIDWELAARGADWDRKPDVLLHEVALEAFRRRYPCS